MKGEDFQEDAPRAGHNSEARNKALDAAIEEWCDKQDEEDDLIEQHIADLRKDKNRIPQRIKQDFDIPIKAFNARAQLRRIERLADSDELVLAVNQMFEATPIGKNIDLVALTERVEKQRAEKEAAKKKAKHTEMEA